MFSVGDRVVVARQISADRDYDPPVGAEGKVIRIDTNSNVRVDFGSTWKNVYEERIVWVYSGYLAHAQVKSFYLVAIQDGKEVMLNDEPTFDDGKEAAAHAAKVSAKLGCKVQPRRIVQDDNAWKQREQTRLDTGHYIKLPAAWDLTPIADHFLHLAREDQSMVAFTESPNHGAMDRQTRMTPGRYLQRYYPQLSQEEMKRYIALVDKSSELKIARTADEIEHVYTYGPHSCMAGPHQDNRDEDEDYECDDDQYFESWCHPVRAYGDSDLAVAYLEASKKRITARAVIWPEKKLYGRVYGDEARLRQALQDQGYRSSASFAEGARIRLIEDKESGALVLPYLDGCNTLKRDPDDPKRLIITYNDWTICADSTDGLAYESQICPKTGERMDEDSGMDVVVSLDPVTTQCWSSYAVEEYAVSILDKGTHPFSYYRSRTYYDRELCVEIGGEGSEDWILKTDAEGPDYGKCAMTGDVYRKDDLVKLADGRLICQDAFEDHDGFECAGNGKNYLGEDGVDVDGERYSKEFIDKRAEQNARRRERRRQAREAQAAQLAA